MSQLQLSGLASGFDWKSVVDQLIQLQRVPQDRLRTQKSSNQARLTGFGSFRTALTDLQTSVKALGADGLFSQRTLSFGNEDLGWTGSASKAAAAGTYSFNVSQLATRSVRNGTTGVAAPMHGSNDVSQVLVGDLPLGVGIKEGTFSVNGQQIEVAATDTLQDVFDRIASATSGAVTASYDSTTDTVTLSSSGAISLGSGSDTSNFLFALKLYHNGQTSVTSGSRLGTLLLNDSIASSGLTAAITNVDGDGNGSFVVNGVSIDFNVNDDTLQNIIGRINGSAAGVTVSYDSSNDRFTLSNKSTGDLDVHVSEAAGGLLEALGLGSTASVTRGVNAEFSVGDGGIIVSASNVLDSSVHGIAGLSVTATGAGQQSITVGSDTKAVEAGIRNFISKYNAVQKFIDDRTRVTANENGTVTTALFAGNRELTDISRQLRSRIFNEVPGLSGTLKRLEGIGIDFDGSSSALSVRDEGRFSDALDNRLDEVAALFTKGVTGLVAKLDDYVGKLVQTGGNIDTQEKSLHRQNTVLDRQIADIERRLKAERIRLEASFIRMEEAQSRISTQLASLQGMLGGPSN